ncbi:protein-export chaperone SecB [Thermophagus sp. OGC60D27]|uniref:protein-export chaperone SecB n=1 Tax=Thermophagus sp. OGC60D27 TaxID=3458415 RepID=UPI004037A1DD
MLAKPSEIQLQNFAVLQSHFNYTPPKKFPKYLKKLFDDYEIDIDFAHHPIENGAIQVFTKISINNGGNTLPGYSLFIEGAGIFFIEEKEGIEISERNNLKFYSTVSILIGYLRNSLSNMTASAPLGPYLLPPIDLKNLFKQKNQTTQL